MKLTIFISLTLVLLVAHTGNGMKKLNFGVGLLKNGLLKNPLLRKIGLKALRKMVTGTTKGALAATLLQNVGEQSHGDSWSLNYYNRKFQMIQATFEVIRQEISQISEVIEAMDTRFKEKKHNDIIMKSVFFTGTAILLCGLAWLAYKMRNNVYLKRMKSLVTSLAGLKSEYKAKVNILKTRQEVDEALSRRQETEENFSLMQQQAAGATIEDI